jgi:hypothetical protein
MSVATLTITRFRTGQDPNALSALVQSRFNGTQESRSDFFQLRILREHDLLTNLKRIGFDVDDVPNQRSTRRGVKGAPKALKKTFHFSKVSCSP